jgi:hypothetical protein
MSTLTLSWHPITLEWSCVQITESLSGEYFGIHQATQAGFRYFDIELVDCRLA